MNTSFKIFLLVALSLLSSFNLSANDTFFSIEKSSDRIEVLFEEGITTFSKNLDINSAVISGADVMYVEVKNLDNFLIDNVSVGFISYQNGLSSSLVVDITDNKFVANAAELSIDYQKIGSLNINRNINGEIVESAQDVYKSVNSGSVKFVLANGGGSWLGKLDNLFTKPHFNQFQSKLTDFSSWGANSTVPRLANYGTPTALKNRIKTLLENPSVTNIRSSDEIIDYIDDFMLQYANKPSDFGASACFDELLKTPSKFKGGSYGLEVLNNLPLSR